MLAGRAYAHARAPCRRARRAALLQREGRAGRGCAAGAEGEVEGDRASAPFGARRPRAPSGASGARPAARTGGAWLGLLPAGTTGRALGSGLGLHRPWGAAAICLTSHAIWSVSSEVVSAHAPGSICQRLLAVAHSAAALRRAQRSRSTGRRRALARSRDALVLLVHKVHGHAHLLGALEHRRTEGSAAAAAPSRARRSATCRGLQTSAL